ncbi:hypothetical protein M758_1G198900 [Ceratodon purpureus]|nr:hypothetical protein M758_1G198900 [Ceratodon purpureus]
MHALPGACTGLRNGGRMFGIACYLWLAVQDLGFGKMMFLFDPEVGMVVLVQCPVRVNHLQPYGDWRNFYAWVRLGNFVPCQWGSTWLCSAGWLAAPWGSQFSGPGQDLTQDFICEYFNMLISFLKINKNKNC